MLVYLYLRRVMLVVGRDVLRSSGYAYLESCDVKL